MNGLMAGAFAMVVIVGVLVTVEACTDVAGGMCPPLVTYGPDVQREARRDLETLPSYSPLHQMMADYMRLRDMVRECPEVAEQ